MGRGPAAEGRLSYFGNEKGASAVNRVALIGRTRVPFGRDIISASPRRSEAHLLLIRNVILRRSIREYAVTQ